MKAKLLSFLAFFMVPALKWADPSSFATIRMFPLFLGYTVFKCITMLVYKVLVMHRKGAGSWIIHYGKTMNCVIN